MAICDRGKVILGTINLLGACASQVDVDRIVVAAAAAAGDRDRRDGRARAGRAQLGLAGQAAVAGEGEHLRVLLVVGGGS